MSSIIHIPSLDTVSKLNLSKPNKKGQFKVKYEDKIGEGGDKLIGSVVKETNDSFVVNTYKERGKQVKKDKINGKWTD